MTICKYNQNNDAPPWYDHKRSLHTMTRYKRHRVIRGKCLKQTGTTGDPNFHSELTKYNFKKIIQS